MRGFDLGDDPEQLVHLEGLRDLTHFGWGVLGALRWRIERFGDAAECFAVSVDPDEDQDVVVYAYLNLVCRLRAGEDVLAEAVTLASTGEPNHLVGAICLHFLVGNAHWEAGRYQAAEAAFLLGLATRESEGGYTELGRLRMFRGDRAGARKAFEQAIQVQDVGSDARYFIAVLDILDGQVEAAAAGLSHIQKWNDGRYLEAARSDPGFLRHADHPAILAILSPPPADTRWLTSLGLGALVADERLASLGVVFVDEAESDLRTGEIRGRFSGDIYPMGTLWVDAWWAASCELAARMVVIAVGPTSHRRGQADLDSAVLVDPTDPSVVYLAVSQSVAPIVWIKVTSDPRPLWEAVQAALPRCRVPIEALPKRYRAFMGYRSQLVVPNPYSGELVDPDFHDLDRFFLFSPYLDPFCWGTAAPDDPFPDRFVPQPALNIKQIDLSRDARSQREGGTFRFTRKSLFSRSHVGYELHSGNLFVWDIRYQPAPFAGVIGRLNSEFGLSYPLDLPVDVAGALLGFGSADSPVFEGMLDNQPGDVAPLIEIIGALRNYDLSVVEVIRRFLDHDDIWVRSTIANVALRYNWMFVLEEQAITEKDPTLREKLIDTIGRGIASPVFNEHGEPDWLDQVLDYDLESMADEEHAP